MGSVIAFIFPIICLFEGIRRSAALGISRNSLILSILGFVFLLAQIGYGDLAHQLHLDVLESLRRVIDIPELPEDWGSEFLPEKRNKDSHEHARIAFLDHGRLSHYFSKSGERLVFAPTSTDLQERERKVVSLAKLEASAEHSESVPVHLALTTGLVILLGVVLGGTRTKAVNQPLNTDAPLCV